MTDAAASGPAAPSLPQGVVTFLFSDVEGSTRMLQAHGRALGPALARHHEIVRQAIESHAGAVFETVGDAVYGAFTRPADALTAAVHAQRRLGRERWPELDDLRVRIAVHSGAVEARGGHYFGPALFECSRLQALAHGGQTICSATTAALALRDLSEDISLRPLGPHRLADMAEPMEILQVDARGLPVGFPPLRASAVAPNNLPHQTTRFVGRTHDLARITDLLAHDRLVSLLGPGGTGKTRLALEVALAQSEHFPDGVWLVELAPISSADLVLTQLADTWGLRPGHSTSLEDAVRRYLAERHLLLVFDNCEHVREGAASVVLDILRAAPGVTVLATSRESLGVPGETEYRLAPLSLPASDADAEQSDAVRLFVDRMRSIRPDYALSPADWAGIVRICRRVEGVPLGLELAAAHVRTLTPAELADRLGTTLAIASSSKSALPRQRTLQATLDWSHDLLDATERMVFRRLAVFAGSFDLAAAEGVSGSGGPGLGTFEGLESLVDKSLVVSMPGSATRFRLLEPIRQYAQQKLEAAGEVERMRAAHADHYADFVSRAAPRTRGPEQFAWDRRIDAEYPNIRVALAYLLGTDLHRYLEVGFDLFAYWMHVGMHMEGIATLLGGLERTPEALDEHHHQLRAWFVLAILLAQITKPEAIAHARRGLKLAQAGGDPNAIGRMELGLGAAIRHSTNDPEYLEHLLQARQLLDEHPQPHWWEPGWEQALVDFILASYLPLDEGRSEAHFEEALAGFQAVGDQALYAAVLAETSNRWGRGDDEALMDSLVRSIELMRPMHLPYWYSHAVLMRGTVLQMEGRAEEAAPCLAEAADLLEVIGDLSCWGSASRRLATAKAELGDAAGAGRLLAKAIESLPVLPMPEAAIPRSLDAAVEILLGLGLLREAAIVLGRSRATGFPVETIVPRDTVLDGLQRRLQEGLGPAALEALMAEGAAAATDDILARAAGWMRSA